RRQGYGARGLRDLCRRLLEQVPTVCLFVRAENVAAIRLYEAIGMEHARAPGGGRPTEGVERPRRLRAVLEAVELELAVATELRRTQETLELALDDRRVSRIVVPELNEIDFGSFAGGPLAPSRCRAGAEPATG